METISLCQHSFSKRALWTAEEIRSYLAEHPISIFARGTLDHPRCGYSARMFDWLETSGLHYSSLDVSSDKSIIPAMNVVFGRCSFPVVVFEGKLFFSKAELDAYFQNERLIAQS